MAGAAREKTTLCWHCRNAVPSAAGAGCSWSRRFQPVPGWEAEETKIWVGGDRRTVPSFRVVRCPEFQAERIGQKKAAAQMRRRMWDTKRAEQLKAEGKSNLDIADMLGVSVSTIRAYFKRPSGGKRAAPDSGPPSPSESEGDSNHPPVEAPADDPPLDTEIDTPPAIAAGVLAELLQQVEPDAGVEYEGSLIHGLGINRAYGPDGKVTETHVYLW